MTTNVSIYPLVVSTSLEMLFFLSHCFLFLKTFLHFIPQPKHHPVNLFLSLGRTHYSPHKLGPSQQLQTLLLLGPPLQSQMSPLLLLALNPYLLPKPSPLSTHKQHLPTWSYPIPLLILTSHQRHLQKVLPKQIPALPLLFLIPPHIL